MNRFKYLEEVIKYVPLDRMMIETVALFMLPKYVENAKPKK